MNLLWFWKIVANELATQCGISTSLDIKTVETRSRSEGDSFFTITLPSFCDDFQKSLADGGIPSDGFLGWRKLSTGKSPLPQFLCGYLGQIFDSEDGRLLDQPNVEAIFAVRQLTLMYGKIARECSQSRLERALTGYVECEQEIRRNDAQLPLNLQEEFRCASTALWGATLQEVDKRVYDGAITPSHGPGRTADRLQGNRKFDQLEWTDRLERVCSWVDFVIPSARYHQEYLPLMNFLEPGAERPVRVVPVPKTLKTPRIIAIEPTCMQYVQQGLLEAFVECLESTHVGSFRARNNGYGMIGFTRQEPNQLLAREGSLSGELATLDLSEASDRVSNQHVRLMLEHFPHLFEAVDASRSRKADVPGHGVVRLAKFASMGSALTFPMEAMVFTTLIFMAIGSVLNSTISPELFQRFRGRVRVYGDDIIVPVEYVPATVAHLEAFGFKVNARKSFWTGKFRESCGKEYYDGHDVSVMRVRRDFPSRWQHVEEIVSIVSLRNQAYALGLWRTAKTLDKKIEKLLPLYPTVLSTSPALGRHSVLGYQTDKVCDELQRPLVKAYVVDPVLPESPVSGVGALMKFFLKRGDEPFEDLEHLQRAGRPVAVRIKPRWITPF